MRSRAPVAVRGGAATVDIGAGYAALPPVVDEPELCGAVPPEPEPEPEPAAGAPAGGVPPGAVPWVGAEPCGGAPDGRRACIAARTFVADRPSCFASAVAGSAFVPLGAWPGVPVGRVLAIAARSFDSVTPSFVASAARSKPPGPDCAWARLADDWLEPAPPDCAPLCVLAAPPQPAPSAAEAPTMTTSLRTFGFMDSFASGRAASTACQKTWSARCLGGA